MSQSSNRYRNRIVGVVFLVLMCLLAIVTFSGGLGRAAVDRMGVDLVLSGHDHDYQCTRPINGTTYIVSGGGAKLRPTGLTDFSVAARSTLHFVDIAAFDDHLLVRAVDQDGMVFDWATLFPRP